jgi:hypothetical protein
MTTLFVRHTVSDYAAWRKVYDAFAPTQKAHGVTAEAVYRAADNPNDVTVTHEFATVDSARSFIARPELKAAMESARLVGPPTIWIADRA